MSGKMDLLSKSIYYQMTDLFEVSAIYTHKDRLIFKTRERPVKDDSMNILRERLNKSGFEVKYTKSDDDTIIEVVPHSKKKLPYLHIILFLATLASIYFAQSGVMMERIEFTFSLIVILLFHEFGHYFTGRRRGVLMSLPYFLPAPNFIGTFGAIIKSRSPLLNRRDLIEVGASGPIAGFVISIIALVIGLQNSQIVMSGGLNEIALGDSLLLKFLSWLIVGPIPEGYDISLSHASFAGWVGILVTMLNLLPMGQLDGGHIIYGLFGKAQHIIGKIFVLVLMGLGFYWPGWWFFGGLVFIFGLKHPPTINDAEPVPFHARLLGIIAILIFIISFIPIPFDFA